MSFREEKNLRVMSNTKRFDWFLFGVVGVLLSFGLVALISASTVISLEKYSSPYFFVTRQLGIGIGIGLLGLVFFSFIPYGWLKKLAWPFFVLALGINSLLIFSKFALTSGGAQRWLSFGPIVFQPSEILKLAFIILLAALLAKRANFFAFLLLTFLVGIVVMLQPDLGTFTLLVLVGIAVFFASGASWKHIGFTFGLGALGIVGLIGIAPYRLNRLLTYLRPEVDPTGAGYQIKQALLAFGSGGLFGLGLGASRQKYSYLPATINDSIFAIIGEEFGFVGVLVVVGLFLLFAWLGLRIAMRAKDQFGKLLAVGITSWIVIQALINMMGISNLLPLTGIPLPFISYGSSAMIASLAGVGILLSISKEGKG